MDYIDYTHNTLSLTTTKDLVEGDFTSICYGWDEIGLLAYQDKDYVTNLDKVFKQYNRFTEQPKYQSIYNINKKIVEDYNGGIITPLLPQSMLIKVGTKLSIPKLKVNIEVYSELSNQVVTGKSVRAFSVDILSDLLKDPNYKPIEKNLKKGYSSYQSSYPNSTVWIWCRALSENIKSETELSGAILDITPFIQSISTSQTNNGGTFTINLSSLICYWDSNKGWVLEKVEKHNINGFINYSTNNQILKLDKDNFLNRNVFYFNTILSENDLVFIRYELLKNEIIINNSSFNEKRKNKIKNRLLENSLSKSLKDLPGNIYDMIGLIDNNSQSISASDSSVTITGRDLWKLLSDDGCYFFPLDFIPGGIFANESDSDYLDRIDGKLVSLCQYAIKSIDFTLKFIINNLSKIKICPTSLFDDYGEDDKTHDLAGLGVSKNFKLDINSKKRIAEQDNKLDKLRKEIYNKIIKSRIKEEITESTVINVDVVDIFVKLNSFIEFLIDNEYIDKNSLGIVTWSVLDKIGLKKDIFDEEEIKTNIINSWFDGKLYKQEGYWAKSTNLNEVIIDAELNRLEKEIKVLNEDTETPEFNIKVSDEYFDSFIQKNIDKNNEKFNSQDATSTVGITGSKQAQLQKAQQFFLELKEKYKNAPLKWVAKKKNILNLNKYGREAFNIMYEFLMLSKDKIDLEYKYEKMKGIWQIVKLMIDDDENTFNKIKSGSNIGKRRILDSTIGNENGSLVSAIKKICQEPFVEFYGDTIGDQYYLIARQPPFTKNDIISVVEKKEYITIEEDDIINLNLSFENGSAYSIYKLEPKNLTEDLGEAAVTAYLKAVHFKQIADIFGEKPLIISSNYLDYHPIIGDKGDLSINSIMKQAVLDLHFIVETNQYLPFTRSGSLMINGDRRIKKGGFIYLKGTDEIFYVESVMNNLSIENSKIERTTQIQVSRGMVIGGENKIHLPLYFKIIKSLSSKDEDKISNLSNLDYDKWLKTVYGDWKVNEAILNFFLQKKQFTNEKYVEATITFGKLKQIIEDISGPTQVKFPFE
jgi:hypothetical protein